MFKDYYQILGISYPSNYDMIKKSYHDQSIKWHPDKNTHCDTTFQMQEINEAYNVLNNNHTKDLYDNEYKKFMESNIIFKPVNSTFEYNYDIQNEDLKEDINKARKQAKEYVDEFLNEFRKVGNSAISSAWEEMKVYIIVGIIMSFIIFCIQRCS